MSVIRGKQLQTYIVGQGGLNGARFTTIQAAIDQAIADGGPAEIVIYPGLYVENLTAAPNDGLVLRGAGADAGVYIQGSITFTNSPATDNLWGFQHLNIFGPVTISGNSGLAFFGGIVRFESCVCFAQVSATGTGVFVTGQDSAFVSAASDALAVDDTGASGSGVRLNGCRLSGGLANRALRCANAFIYWTEVIGRLEKAPAANLTLYHCEVSASDQAAITLQSSAGTDRVYASSLERTGAAGAAIDKTGAGALSRTGNSFIGTVTSPPVNVAAGTESLGESLEGFVTEVGGVAIGQRQRINLIQGTGVTLAGVDDAANDRVNVTVTATGGGGGSSPTADDKNQTPAASSGSDGFDTTLTTSNLPVGYVGVSVNGVSQHVAASDAERTTADCYFSSDGGATAETQGSITSGSTLYWNPTVAGFDLTVSQRVDFIYNV